MFPVWNNCCIKSWRNQKRFANWHGLKYPLKIDDWKTFEKNNGTTALNILYIKEKEIYPAYISKHNATREKQIILLMIPNEEKQGCHYLAVKQLSALLHWITSKHKDDFYCLNCLHSFRTENLLKKHVKIYGCSFVANSMTDFYICSAVDFYIFNKWIFNIQQTHIYILQKIFKASFCFNIKQS